MLKSLLKEPLLHFLLLALAIFAVHGLVSDVDEKTDSIVVTAPKIEQMATLFAKTWQRSPTPEELKGLIDDHVKEEILVRQALALGLDKDDTVVRRRLRQKMEFLNAAEAEALEATDAELQAYLDANPDAFRIDGALAFQQVFVNPQRRGQATGQDAASILEVLLSDPEIDRSGLGDPTLLPPDLPLSTTTQISQTFGAEFAEALSKVPPGPWTGPVASTYGQHLVRVTERLQGRTPVLDEVREAVAREWTNARRQELEDARLAELLKGYSVTIESPAGMEAPE
ncbi:peptidylprolyl isomerase [Mesorhizobium sp. KR9-304]|uniref:peptidylprolyl isomerase n=1 Tax=Mesorhizobium sp. KR9-304 TaxID=3156614 RepID=UPI0032B34365